MSFYVYDGHVTASLLVISPFGDEGRPMRGTYPKDLPEDNKAAAEWKFATSLLRLDHAQEVVDEKDLVKRGDLLRQDQYRGSLLYTAVEDRIINFAELHQAFVDTKAAYNAAVQEVQGVAPIEETTDPVQPTQPLPSAESNQPTWQKLGFKSYEKWVKAGSPTE